MKIEINVVKKPRKGDVAVFDGKEWVLAHSDSLTKAVSESVEALKGRISDVEADIRRIKGE